MRKIYCLLLLILFLPTLPSVATNQASITRVRVHVFINYGNFGIWISHTNGFVNPVPEYTNANGEYTKNLYPGTYYVNLDNPYTTCDYSSFKIVVKAAPAIQSFHGTFGNCLFG